VNSGRKKESDQGNKTLARRGNGTVRLDRLVKDHSFNTIEVPDLRRELAKKGKIG